MSDVPVFCLHCGTRQDWEQSQWGAGPSSLRVSFSCPQCGWSVEAKACTWEFLLEQMNAAG